MKLQSKYCHQAMKKTTEKSCIYFEGRAICENLWLKANNNIVSYVLIRFGALQIQSKFFILLFLKSHIMML